MVTSPQVLTGLDGKLNRAVFFVGNIFSEGVLSLRPVDLGNVNVCVRGLVGNHSEAPQTDSPGRVTVESMAALGARVPDK